MTSKRMFSTRKPVFQKFIRIVLCLPVLWTVGAVWFLSGLPVLSPESIAKKTDALVVLTGGKGRLETGFRLLEKGDAAQLFISGVYQGVEVNNLLERAHQSPSSLNCCTTLGYEAHNTAGNATETAAWIQKNKYHSLKLITAHYHMPRALLEFRMALPKTVEIVPYPITPPSFTIKGWWKGHGRIFLLIGEYHKYMVTRAKYELRRVL